jgi:Predicted periplasmic lipoprotein (DUF2279)
MEFWLSDIFFPVKDKGAWSSPSVLTIRVGMSLLAVGRCLFARLRFARLAHNAPTYCQQTHIWPSYLGHTTVSGRGRYGLTGCIKKSNFLTVLLFVLPLFGWSQNDTIHFLDPAPSFRPQRFWPISALGAGTYTGAVLGLNQLWYANYPRSGFHFFNDWDEWQQMDKMGHAVASYQETRLGYQLMGWTGLSNRKAIWSGLAIGTVMQGTLEVLDGFSTEWGFSYYDIGFNAFGGVLATSEQLLWGEQRIMLKISMERQNYPSTTVTSLDGSSSTTLKERGEFLYGNSFPSTLLKDYNYVSYWLSFNIKDFTPKSKMPPWLGVAVGYGAQNLYSGRDNSWVKDDAFFDLDPSLDPYRQFMLSPDIHFSRIKTRSPYLRTALSILDIVKIPLPTLIYQTGTNKFDFKPILF